MSLQYLDLSGLQQFYSNLGSVWFPSKWNAAVKDMVKSSTNSSEITSGSVITGISAGTDGKITVTSTPINLNKYAKSDQLAHNHSGSYVTSLSHSHSEYSTTGHSHSFAGLIHSHQGYLTSLAHSHDFAHSHSGYARNTFSNIKVGSTTIEADTTTDTLTLVAGTNITITPDATNDTVTIASVNTDEKVKSTAGTGKYYILGHSNLGHANAQSTYGNNKAYVDNGHLYSNNERVSTTSHTHSGYLTSASLAHSHSGYATTGHSHDIYTTTWRPIQLDGEEVISSSASGLALNLTSSGNVIPSMADDGEWSFNVDLSSYAKKSDLVKLLDYKGTVGNASGATVTSLPASHAVGDVYVVKNSSTAVTTIGGVSVQNGDMFICITDGSAVNNDHWTVVQGNCTITDKSATIGTSLTTIATIDGVDIKAKIGSYASSSHTHSTYANQNAFSKVAVSGTTGQPTVEADTTTDTIEFAAGNHIIITSDASADKVTWGVDATAITETEIAALFDNL